MKSNGCIILIAALSPTQILVTSKHSIGSNINVTTTGGVSHSERGEYWLEIHLSRVGKTKADLAKKLWDEEWTAVAEVSKKNQFFLSKLIRTNFSLNYDLAL